MAEANTMNTNPARGVNTNEVPVPVKKERSPNTGLSSRGAIVLRTLSLFLARSRKNKAAETPTSVATKPSCNKRKMNESSNSKNSNVCSLRLMETLKKDTHFNKLDEIDGLYKIYKKLVSSSKMNLIYINAINIGHPASITKTNKIQEGIDRLVFQELLHNTFNLVTEDTLMDRIFCAWDKNNEGLLKAEMWIGGLSIFLRGTFEEKIQYCFRVYDLNSDGFISKDEMFQLLKNCLVKQPQEEDPDEGVRDLVEIILRKLDIDRDGKVSFEDYATAVRGEPLLLEAFGQCLPTDGACRTFLSTLHA